MIIILKFNIRVNFKFNEFENLYNIYILLLNKLVRLWSAMCVSMSGPANPVYQGKILVLTLLE